MEAVMLSALFKYGTQAGQNIAYLLIMGWCVMKIKNQCKSLNSMSEAMKEKVEKERFDEKYIELKTEMKEMKSDNKEDHDRLFDKIDELPAKIFKLIKP